MSGSEVFTEEEKDLVRRLENLARREASQDIDDLVALIRRAEHELKHHKHQTVTKQEFCGVCTMISDFERRVKEAVDLVLPSQNNQVSTETVSNQPQEVDSAQINLKGLTSLSSEDEATARAECNNLRDKNTELFQENARLRAALEKIEALSAGGRQADKMRTFAAITGEAERLARQALEGEPE